MPGIFTALLNLIGIVAKIALELAAALLRAIVKFFSTPPEQFGAKVMAVLVAVALGFVSGDLRGRHEERAVWEQRQAEHAEAMEQLREHTADEARSQVKEAQEKEQTDATAEENRIQTYAQTLPRPATDDCRITDSDLSAGGVQNARKPGSNLRRNPFRLQRGPQAGAAR